MQLERIVMMRMIYGRRKIGKKGYLIKYNILNKPARQQLPSFRT